MLLTRNNTIPANSPHSGLSQTHSYFPGQSKTDQHAGPPSRPAKEKVQADLKEMRATIASSNQLKSIVTQIYASDSIS